MTFWSLTIAINFGLRLLHICRNRKLKKQKVEKNLFDLYQLLLKALEEKNAKLKSKREEVERKARRGEIDPMHEHAIQIISQVIVWWTARIR